MSSWDLVGRPLVPFFDTEENVNNSLEFAEGHNEREDIDVDARVWDKELGYFVYPSEHSRATSAPVAIAAVTRERKADSGSKLLLTPSMMLSSSAPNSLDAERTFLSAAPDGVGPRSCSAKREPKQAKTRPSASRCPSEAVDDASTANVSSRKEKSKGGNTTSYGAQSGHRQQPRNGKVKEQLSDSGKWAWSAFQSSPDPAELPMPPFLAQLADGVSNCDGSISASTSAAPSPLPPVPPVQLVTAAPAPSLSLGSLPAQPPQPPLPPIPTAPPDVTVPAAPMSAELSMTQDLRRMLNIGGG
ncbi:unnamed protein product [Hyaloperonospora brassicae]|uniref:Uncharacterized protein n=1 Tax=Hyaloperonospora brassicae TaxID=162125 RepID=A0AAV0V291_HYABA|nr:unnamed protein product [Hyaloperonospora brassicae]